jgi:SepF-like predicted cell division protein (DUF552 family)
VNAFRFARTVHLSGTPYNETQEKINRAIAAVEEEFEGDAVALDLEHVIPTSTGLTLFWLAYDNPARPQPTE